MNYRCSLPFLIAALLLLSGCGMRLPASPVNGAAFLSDADSQASLEAIAQRRSEITTARMLLRGTVTQGKSRFSGKYAIVSTSAPFQVRVELFPVNLGPSLFLGSFTLAGGFVVDGASGERQTLSTLEIPLVENGPRYDLSVLVPLLTGRTWDLNPLTVTVLKGENGTFVYDRAKNAIAMVNEEGLPQEAFFLADNGRVRAKVLLQQYHLVDGISVPQRIELTEFTSDSSGEFEVVALALNRPVKEELFQLTSPP